MKLTIQIRIGSDKSETVLGRESSQDCPLSTTNAILYIHRGIHKRGTGGGAGIEVGRKLIQVMHFGDDQTLLPRNKTELQKMVEKPNNTSKKFAMKINMPKTS